MPSSRTRGWPGFMTCGRGSALTCPITWRLWLSSARAACLMSAAGRVTGRACSPNAALRSSGWTQAEGIGDDVPLAAPGALARVIPAALAALAGQDGLGVQHPGRGRRVPARSGADLAAQRVMDPVPGAIGGPGPVPAVRGIPG